MKRLRPCAVSLVALATLMATSTPLACGHEPEASQALAAPMTLRSLYGLKPPVALEPSTSALVLVDFQDEFFHGKLPLPGRVAAARHAAELLLWARGTGALVVHVRNVAAKASSPLFTPGAAATAFVPELAPLGTEAVVTKSAAGGFTHTNLDEILRAHGADTVIVAGLMTHLAVDSTARDGTLLGYRIVVAADATATRALPDALGDGQVPAELVQRVALSSLADRFADVLTTRQIVAAGR